ncbi:MAG TPA: type III PLP-dependent enzyme [Pseudonocardiaceae bacterium]|nr:type III PLP-dependent enzyme [Pseudonocardiaceae bacterium]
MLPDALTQLVTGQAGSEAPLCVYAYDVGGIAAHARRVVTSLPERCRMYYAMKANSAAPVLAALAPVVAGFEVASGGEVTKARAAGQHVPVIFGGPAKTSAEIRSGITCGVARFHAESTTELARLSAVAADLGRTVEVLLRVNLAGPFPQATLAMAGKPTQFGIDERELPEAIELARRLPAVRLVGFHLHSLSNNLDAAAHLEVLDLYRRKVTGWEKEHGVSCEVVNVGGGIGINFADLDAQFDWDTFTTGLARLVHRTFPEHWGEIQFECGRFLVAPYGWYACEVLDVKRNHGENYVILRGGTHHFRLPVSWQHSHPFTVLPVDRWELDHPRPELAGEPVTVVGELCSPKDVLARGVAVDRIRVGDVVVFRYAGAYGWEISHHDFLSHPRPDHVYL